MNTTNFHPIFWYSYKCLHIYWFASWNNADRAHCEVHICLSFDELCLERRALCLWGRADSQPHHVGKPCTTLLLQSYSCYHDFTIPNTMLNGSGICRENNSSTQIIIPTVKSSVAGFLNIEKLVWGISTLKYGIIHCRLRQRYYLAAFWPRPRVKPRSLTCPLGEAGYLSLFQGKYYQSMT